MKEREKTPFGFLGEAPPKNIFFANLHVHAENFAFSLGFTKGKNQERKKAIRGEGGGYFYCKKKEVLKNGAIPQLMGDKDEAREERNV